MNGDGFVASREKITYRSGVSNRCDIFLRSALGDYFLYFSIDTDGLWKNTNGCIDENNDGEIAFQLRTSGFLQWEGHGMMASYLQ